MNAKLCKQLRKIADGMTVGWPDRAYTASKRGTHLLNGPKTTRGLYRQMKKSYAK